MKYLLDVNVLLGLGFEGHQFHDRVSLWIQSLTAPELLTCSITELGFVRVLAQTPSYDFDFADALALLLRLKATSALKFNFVSDNHDVSRLPPWINSARQITDGHLAQLAKDNGAVLATLDRGIPGAFVIP